MSVNSLQGRSRELAANSLLSARSYNDISRLLRELTAQGLSVQVSPDGGMLIEEGGQSSGLPVPELKGRRNALAGPAAYNRLARLLRNAASSTMRVGVNTQGGLQIEPATRTCPASTLRQRVQLMPENGRVLPSAKLWETLLLLITRMSSSAVDIGINAQGGVSLVWGDYSDSSTSASGSSSSGSSSSQSAPSGSSSSSGPIYVPVEVVARATAPTTLTVEYLLCQSYNRSGDPYDPAISEDPSTSYYRLVMRSNEYQAGDAFAVGFCWGRTMIPPEVPPGPVAVTCCGTYCGTYSIATEPTAGHPYWQYVALVEIAADGTISVTPYPTPSPTPFPS